VPPVTTVSTAAALSAADFDRCGRSLTKVIAVAPVALAAPILGDARGGDLGYTIRSKPGSFDDRIDFR
jgi:hypothetical protein